MNTAVKYHWFGDSIAIHHQGRTFMISKDDKRFTVICDLIQKDSLDTVPLVADSKGGYFKVLSRILESLGE
jgi:hypothetical protein